MKLHVPDIDESRLRETEDALCLWAVAVRQGYANGLPKETIISKVIKLGVEGASIRAHEQDIDDQVLRIDQLIATLPKRKKKAIKYAYLGNRSPSEIAVILRLTIKEYWSVLKAAKMDLASRL